MGELLQNRIPLMNRARSASQDLSLECSTLWKCAKARGIMVKGCRTRRGVCKKNCSCISAYATPGHWALAMPVNTPRSMRLYTWRSKLVKQCLFLPANAPRRPGGKWIDELTRKALKKKLAKHEKIQPRAVEGGETAKISTINHFA